MRNSTHTQKLILVIVSLLCIAPGGPDPEVRALYPSHIVVPGLDPRAVPSSAWLRSRAALYRATLRPWQNEVLVVPFDVQGYAVDAIARSLMTRILVDALEAGGHRVANPEHIEQVLGGPERRWRAGQDDLRDAFEVATLLRVKRVVIGHTGHLLDGKLRITVRTWDQEKGGGWAEHPSRVWDRDSLPLGDTQLPSQTFRSHLAEIVSSVQGAFEPERPVSADGTEPAIPASPESLVAAEGDPLLAAHHLQLLGRLHGPGRAGERLFERSLIALWRVSPDARHRSLLEARAWWHLHRRPAALAALEGAAPGPAATALRAFLDGNLDASAQPLDAIGSPLLRWQARLDHRFLRRAYGEDLRETDERLLAELPEAWRDFAAIRLWGRIDLEGTGRIKLRMDESFPVVGLGLRDQMIEDVLLGRGSVDERELRLSARRHHDRLLEVEGDAPLQTAGYWRPHSSDLLDLLVGAAETSLFAWIESGLHDDDGLRRIEEYAGLYAEHPRLEALRLEHLSRRAKQARGSEREQLQRRAGRLAQRIHVWEGGQGALTTSIDPTHLFDADFPTHPDFFWPRVTPELVGFPAHGQVDQLWSIESHIAYTTTNTLALERLHARLSEAGHRDAAAELVRRNAHRFLGSPRRPALLTEGQASAPEPPALEHGVPSGTTSWGAYRDAAQPHLFRGDLDEAARTLRRYPPFAGKANGVGPGRLALRAWEAGSEFFWRGDGALSASFFEIAARSAPGSNAGLGAGFRLRLLQGRWGEAALVARKRAATTESVYAARDFLMILHMLGHHDEAWTLFERAALESEDPQLWAGAFVGHRIQARSDDEMADWLLAPRRLRARGGSAQAALRRFLMLALLQDRAPSPEWPRLVRRAHESIQMTALGGHVKLTRAEIDEMVEDSAAADLARVSLYAAWKRGSFEEAWRHFRAPVHPGMPDMKAIDVAYSSLFLPYTAWTAEALGREAEFEAELERAVRQREDRPASEEADERGFLFDVALARAAQAGLRGEHERSLAALRAALHVRAYTNARILFTWYQLAEICEALHRATGHGAYGELVLELAREHARIQPMFGWAWALVARLGASEAERAEALRKALYLDPRSAFLEGIAPVERAAALRWLEEHTPFPVEEAGEQEGVAI